MECFLKRIVLRHFKLVKQIVSCNVLDRYFLDRDAVLSHNPITHVTFNPVQDDQPPDQNLVVVANTWVHSWVVTQTVVRVKINVLRNI